MYRDNFCNFLKINFTLFNRRIVYILSLYKEERKRETTRSNDGQCLVYEPLKIQERTASPISSSSSSRLRRRCPRTSSSRTHSRRLQFTMWSNDRHYNKINECLTRHCCFLLNAHEENLINKRDSLFLKYKKKREEIHASQEFVIIQISLKP